MATTKIIDQNDIRPQPYVGRISWAIADGDGGTSGPIKTANTARDGTGTVNTIFTAAANGSEIARVRLMPAGTNVASVVRLFINNGSTNTNKDNNRLIPEATLPETTSSEEEGQSPVEIQLSLMLPAGYKILATIGTTVAAGWHICGIGGDY